MNTDSSQNRRYTSSDMAKIYCEKCNGCGDCCHGMTDTIHLDPYDIYLLCSGLQTTFQQLWKTALRSRILKCRTAREAPAHFFHPTEGVKFTRSARDFADCFL